MNRKSKEKKKVTLCFAFFDKRDFVSFGPGRVVVVIGGDRVSLSIKFLVLG